MEFVLRATFLLFLVTATVTVKAADPSANDPEHEAVVLRHKRRSDFSVFDILRGKGASTIGPKPTKAPGADGIGFNLADALNPDPKPPTSNGGNGFGFSLDDALRPADKPAGGDCQANVVQKLNTVIENQNQQLRLLQQLLARSRP